jgi:putative transposase
MFDATRIRLHPTNQQAQALAVQFGCARWVWNNALAKTGELYRATGKGLNYLSRDGDPPSEAQAGV